MSIYKSAYYKEVDKELSPFKQEITDDPFIQVMCKHCGGKHFDVACGFYETKIRCIKCLWEDTIHDG